MLKEIERTIFRSAIEQGVELSEKDVEKLARYLLEILRINKKINLTAVRDPAEAAIKHIVDSLVVEKVLDKEDSIILDLGTGGGFPGVPLAAVNGERNVSLLDARAKKLKAIEECSKIAGIHNLFFLPHRAEEAGREPNFRGHFDVCTARAVAQLRELLEMAVPFIKVGGKLIAMKETASIKQELENASRAMEIMQVKLSKVYEYSLCNNQRRSLLVFIKEAKTLSQYPRRAPAISKRPL